MKRLFTILFFLISSQMTRALQEKFTTYSYPKLIQRLRIKKQDLREKTLKKNFIKNTILKDNLLENNTRNIAALYITKQDLTGPSDA